MTALDIPALLAELTLEEKASLLSGSDFWHTQGIPRLGIPAVMLTDGPHGLRKQTSDTSRPGLAESVPATCFPTAAALASSWDVDLLRRVGEALGEETRAEGVAVLLGPGVNIKRSPLCGRNFEYFSEDPLLTGELAAALVRGVQSRGVGTSLKHFAANNQETDRLRIDVRVDERTLREIYLPAFERVVRTARPWTVMCAYNRVNGVYAAQHRQLLTDILREEWGFAGLVVSDWGAVDDRVPSLRAGLDLEMPANDGSTDAELVAAVRSGALDGQALDVAVTRLLTLLNQASPALEDPPGYDAEAHHALARTAAADGAVLLTNDGVLPLRPVAGDTIAVIGEFARTPRYQGAGSSQVRPTRLDDALGALRAAVPGGVQVCFAPGFRLPDGTTGGIVDGTTGGIVGEVVGGEGLVGDDGDDAVGRALRAEAVELAGRAALAVVFLGLPAGEESEGFDRTRLDLPAAQLRVLEEVTRANARVVVVLANGAVVATEGWADRVGAVLECWLGGQAGGSGAVDVLLGAVNPSGRLAETIPLRLEDTPAHLNWPGDEGQVRYGEGIFVGYRYYDTVRREVAFPFGHGLSYTTFEYSDLETAVGPGGGLTVTVTVTNTGPVAGREVVQVYASQPVSSVSRPARWLVAFAKPTLRPGESRRVAVEVERRLLGHWSRRAGRWVLPGGGFEIAVGASSRDLRLRSDVEVPVDRIGVALTASATLGEWLADPVGGPLLREVMGAGPAGPLPGVLSDPELASMVGSMPLQKLVGMRMGLTADALAAVLARV